MTHNSDFSHHLNLNTKPNTKASKLQTHPKYTQTEIQTNSNPNMDQGRQTDLIGLTHCTCNCL